MPTLFWTGKLSWPMMWMVNANNVLAWCTGNARDAAAMKNRIRQGYDGTFSEHVTRYDELGAEFQTKAAEAQLAGVDLQDKVVLDVGCGTGIISLLALRKGAAKVVCGDISNYMLEVARAKADKQGCGAERIDFRQLDAEELPFADASFDCAVTGMTLGLYPHPEKAVAEMARVVRPGASFPSARTARSITGRRVTLPSGRSANAMFWATAWNTGRARKRRCGACWRRRASKTSERAG